MESNLANEENRQIIGQLDSLIYAFREGSKWDRLMPKSLRETEGFVVRFTKTGRVTFFVTHKGLGGSDRDPIVVNPEDLSAFMSDAVRYLRNPARHRERFRRRWG
jgi:hypothetical protein